MNHPSVNKVKFFKTEYVDRRLRNKEIYSSFSSLNDSIFARQEDGQEETGKASAALNYSESSERQSSTYKTEIFTFHIDQFTSQRSSGFFSSVVHTWLPTYEQEVSQSSTRKWVSPCSFLSYHSSSSPSVARGYQARGSRKKVGFPLLILVS